MCLGAHPQLAALLGELPLFAGASWPIAEPAEASTNPAGGNGGELSEKEKKKLAKQAEKEAKKAKAEVTNGNAKAVASASACLYPFAGVVAPMAVKVLGRLLMVVVACWAG